MASPFGTAPLTHAAESGHAEELDLLLQAGAAVDREHNGNTALSMAVSRENLLRLLEADADPRHLAHEKQRMFLGFDPEPSDAPLATVSERECTRITTTPISASLARR